MTIEIKDNRNNVLLSEEFLPNRELEKTNSESAQFICTQCGECCHIREKKNMTLDEESAYTSYMYTRFGIIYLANLSEITINVWPEEKTILEKEALKSGINLNIKPKRAVHNSKTNELIILDYFIDHDICPFFDKKTKLCGVYELRPLICKSYPLLTTQNLGKCRYKKLDVNAYGSEKEAAIKLDQRIAKQKQILLQMIQNKEIVIHDMTDLELHKILSTAVFKELRIN